MLTAQEFFEEGSGFFEKQDYFQALAHFTKAIELGYEPLDVVYSKRAMSYYHNGEYSLAIIDTSKEIELSSDNKSKASAYSNLGVILQAQGQYEKAVWNHCQAIIFDPDCAIFYRNRGVAYSYLEDYSAAFLDYTKAIYLDANEAVNYYYRGVVYARQKKYAEAILDYSSAIKLNPDFIEAYNDRSVAYTEVYCYEKAVEDCNKIIEFDPNYISAYNNRAHAYNSMEKFVRAFDDCNKAILLNENYVEAYNNRAIAYMGLGNSRKAIDDYSKAIELNRNYLIAYKNRGNTYYLLGNYVAAQSDWLRLIHLDNGSVIADFFGLLAFFFQNVSFAPYIVRQMYEKVPEAVTMHSFQNVLVQTEEQCQIIDTYLINVGKLKRLEEVHPVSYYVLEAYVNFYMGTVGISFKIFNEILRNQLGHKFSLREEYYLLYSSELFQEPSEIIKSNALKRAQIFSEAFDVNLSTENEQVELYYAGLLFFYSNEIEKAHHCFTRVFLQFAPAAYMQVLTLEKLNLFKERDKKIERIRKWEFSQPSPLFLNGFTPKYLDLNGPDFLLPIYEYLFHNEIIEAVQLVRQDEDEPFQSPIFWEAFLLTDQEVKEVHKNLFTQALKILQKDYVQKLESEPVEENSRWRQYQAKEDFEELKSLSSDSDALENRIAELIYLSDIESVYCEYFIKYFHYQQNIGIMAAYSLYHYLLFMKEIKKGTSDINITGYEKWIEEVTKAAVTGALGVIIDWKIAAVSIPLNISVRILGKIYGKKIGTWISSAKPEIKFQQYNHIKNMIIAGLYEDIENQHDNNAVYEKYIIPELQKWISKKPKL